MQLIIPMSGVGQRFKDCGYETPKPLIRIAGKPMVQHIVELFDDVEDVLFIVNKEHFEDVALNMESTLLAISPKAKIAVIESHKLGPAWAIYQARDFVTVDEPVVVNYCDFGWSWDFASFKEELHSGIDGLIATYTGFHPHMLRNSSYAFLSLDNSGNLNMIREKSPFTSSPMDELASSGTYGFGSGQILLDAIQEQIFNGESFNGEYYISLTYLSMIHAGKVIKSFQIDKFLQWGTPEDLEDFESRRRFFAFKLFYEHTSIDVDRVEILAAGEGKRFSDAGYLDGKPFLPVGDSDLVLQSLRAIGEPLESKGVLFRKDHKISREKMSEIENFGISISQVDGLTTGQAASAMVALSRTKSGNCIVGTCDSLLYPDPTLPLPRNRKVIGVWVTHSSEYARKNPEQFGWVELGDGGEMIKSWIKTRPLTENDVFLITGTFFFGDVPEALKLLPSFLRESKRVNNEYYLDSLLAFAKDNDWEVIGMKPEWFVSLGTPEEYETYRYWESYFISRPDLLLLDE